MNKKLLIPISLLIVISSIALIFTQVELQNQKKIKQIQEQQALNNVAVDPTTYWNTATTNVEGSTFKYPELGTTYINAQTWPPEVEISSDIFSCKGEIATIASSGTTYCIQTTSEGAAGTIFNSYSYTYQKKDKVVKFTFTLGFPQCANYDDPNKTACKYEQNNFDLNKLIDAMAQTLNL